jgi:hypothetical protein
MSTCWKCGRELPEGQVECEPFCAQDATNDPVYAARNGKGFCLNFQFTPDPDKIKTPGDEMMFRKVFQEWMMAIVRSFSSTGLNTFCKKIPPEGDDD